MDERANNLILRYMEGRRHKDYPHHTLASLDHIKCWDCHKMDMELLSYEEEGWRSKKKYDDLFRKICNTKCDIKGGIPHQEPIPQSSTHIGNGMHSGLFVGTLTMSPNDGLTEDDMVKAITKIFAQQTVPCDKSAWYVEYTKNGVPHIHFAYETRSGGRIHKKIFQRYWKIWDEPRNQTGKSGFGGGYHSPAKSPIAYLEYMSKDEGRHCVRGFQKEDIPV